MSIIVFAEQRHTSVVAEKHRVYILDKRHTIAVPEQQQRNRFWTRLMLIAHLLPDQSTRSVAFASSVARQQCCFHQ